jgi:hypothetical protein
MRGQDSGVSAFAADRHFPSTNDTVVKASPLSITIRLPAADKVRFASIAARSGMSESALALVAIRRLIDPGGKPLQTAPSAPERVAATDRITIRLRPGDGLTIARRAAGRGMKASGYLAALVRAHVRANPPMPTTELADLKEGVAVLAVLGNGLARLGRNLTGADREGLRHDLGATRAAVAVLEVRMHNLAKAALIAWESRGE